jgi:uncharacterized protein YlxP (DUF503 family)
MVVGTLRITLTLFESATLKDKRAVVRRLRDRVSNRFNAAVAEVDNLDLVGTATIGVACLSNAEPHAHAQLMKILRFVESLALDAEISDVETEIVHL